MHDSQNLPEKITNIFNKAYNIIELCTNPGYKCTQLTPAHWAAITGNKKALERIHEVAPEILQQGTHPAFKKQPDHPESVLPIDYATALGNNELVDFLKEKGSRGPNMSIVEKISAPKPGPNEEMLQNREEIGRKEEKEQPRTVTPNPPLSPTGPEIKQTTAEVLPVETKNEALKKRIKRIKIDPESNYSYKEIAETGKMHTYQSKNNQKEKYEDAMIFEPDKGNPIEVHNNDNSKETACQPYPKGLSLSANKKNSENCIIVGTNFSDKTRQNNTSFTLDLSSFQVEKGQKEVSINLQNPDGKTSTHITFKANGKITCETAKDQKACVDIKMADGSMAYFNEKGAFVTDQGKPLKYNSSTKSYVAPATDQVGVAIHGNSKKALAAQVGDVINALKETGLHQTDQDTLTAPLPGSAKEQSTSTGYSKR